MHRSNFRVKKPLGTPIPSREAPKAAPPDTFLRDLKEQIANLARDIDPLKANVERLAAPKKDIAVPADVARSLGEAHNRLDRVEKNLAQIEAQLKKMSTTFSNALLRMGDKVEKISGGEDSSFSLAHSLEKLISVLASQKLDIIRDSDGDMVAVKMDTSPTGGE
jgi:ABC-type transporter Mla subunit MlaD